jgi:peptide/nickel transport system permease protein
MNTIGRRVVGAFPVLLGISFLIFLLMHIAPGDPITLLLGDDATPADIERLRREWGLDQPLIIQYFHFLSRAVRGDFGMSLKFNEPVMRRTLDIVADTGQIKPEWQDRSAAEDGFWTNKYH